MPHSHISPTTGRTGWSFSGTELRSFLWWGAAALEVAAREPARREAVWRHVEVLSSTLGTRFDSPICPILIGGAQEALAASR